MTIEVTTNENLITAHKPIERFTELLLMSTIDLPICGQQHEATSQTSSLIAIFILGKLLASGGRFSSPPPPPPPLKGKTLLLPPLYNSLYPFLIRIPTFYFHLSSCKQQISMWCLLKVLANSQDFTEMSQHSKMQTGFGPVHLEIFFLSKSECPQIIYWDPVHCFLCRQ